MHTVRLILQKAILQFIFFGVLLALAACASTASRTASEQAGSRTEVSIVGDEFYLNGRPTYEGRTWEGYKIQGLLMNARMIQGVFDDLNPETRERWKYPDTGTWDPDRNTQEFIAAMPSWRQNGLLNFTINLQGGSPEGYSKTQPWENNAYEPDGSLRTAYMDRLKQILDKADELGMTVIVGYFYFGQDERLRDESAVIQAVDNVTNWMLDQRYRHVLVEINNECDLKYDHAILRPERVHELINRVKQTKRQGRRLLVSTSYQGGALPGNQVIEAADFVLLHGNSVRDPDRIAALVRQVRQQRSYTPKPILINEDDHFQFDQSWNNCRAAISEYCSWGYFDPGKNNYQDGYQSMPVNWQINTPLKESFFAYVREITGAGENRPDLSAVHASPIFEEQDGLLVWEVESAPATGEWTLQKDVTGYSGSGYYEWRKGNTDLKMDPAGSGTLTYKVKINQPGRYHFQIRSAAPHPTDYNDVWVRFPDTGAYRQKGTTHEPLGRQWFKVYQNQAENKWNWDTHTKDHDAHDIYAEFPQAGVYRVELAGRSSQFKVDRLILYSASQSAARAQDLVNAESKRLASSAAPTTSAPFAGNPVTITGERKKWHTLTITFDGPASSETAANNPFLNYRLNVTFTGPNGSSYVVPGYYAADGNAGESGASSGNKWRVHFCPNEEGEWRYAVSFRQGKDIAVDESTSGEQTAFDGASGAFRITNTDKTGADFRGKGKLQYVGEHYLRHANGQYYLKDGADSPENLLAYADFDSTYSHGEKSFVKTYQAHVADWKPGDPSWRNGKGKGLIGGLNYLASKGVNSVYFLTMNVNGDGKDVWPWTSHTERERFDVSKLDQWEKVFAHMDKLGLMLHIVTQETENEMLLDDGNVGRLRKLYYRELIARFGHHLGITWNLGEENSTNQDNPRGQNDAQRKAMASYFKKHDPYQSFVVIHTHPKFPNREEVYTPLLGYPDFNGPSIQTEGIAEIHQETIKWLTRSAEAGVKWVVNQDEIGPANIGVKPDAEDFWHDDVRKMALWGNLMAGGGGAEWYFGYEYPHNDLTCEDWRSRDHMWDLTRHALTFFHTYLPFPQMHSCDALISGKTGYCLAKPGEVYAIYLPNGGTTQLNLGNNPGNYSVQWYNPRTGGELLEGSVRSLNGGSSRSIGYPPADRSKDWVVLIRRQ